MYEDKTHRKAKACAEPRTREENRRAARKARRIRLRACSIERCNYLLARSNRGHHIASSVYEKVLDALTPEEREAATAFRFSSGKAKTFKIFWRGRKEPVAAWTFGPVAYPFDAKTGTLIVPLDADAETSDVD